MIRVRFSPDGKTLASVSDDNTAKLWDLQGQELSNLKGHSYWVVNLAYSPDGKTLATGGWDGKVILWDLNLDQLMAKGCQWMQDYFQHNSKVLDSDRQLCNPAQ